MGGSNGELKRARGEVRAHPVFTADSVTGGSWVLTQPLLWRGVDQGRPDTVLAN